MMYRNLPALVPALVIAAAAAWPAVGHAKERLPRGLAELSSADFARAVIVADDPAVGAVVLSTRDGYSRTRPLQGAHANDVHLRALVDRSSARARWQVWHDLVTVRGHQGITAVHYTLGGKQRTARLIDAQYGLGDCPPADGLGMCNRRTRITFELPEHAMREIAASYDRGSRAPWRIRFQDASGRDVISGISPAEAAGLVKALDSWRRQSGGIAR